MPMKTMFFLSSLLAAGSVDDTRLNSAESALADSIPVFENAMSEEKTAVFGQKYLRGRNEVSAGKANDIKNKTIEVRALQGMISNVLDDTGVNVLTKTLLFTNDSAFFDYEAGIGEIVRLLTIAEEALENQGPFNAAFSRIRETVDLFQANASNIREQVQQIGNQFNRSVNSAAAWGDFERRLSRIVIDSNLAVAQLGQESNALLMLRKNVRTQLRELIADLAGEEGPGAVARENAIEARGNFRALRIKQSEISDGIDELIAAWQGYADEVSTNEITRIANERLRILFSRIRFFLGSSTPILPRITFSSSNLEGEFSISELRDAEAFRATVLDNMRTFPPNEFEVNLITASFVFDNPVEITLTGTIVASGFDPSPDNSTTFNCRASVTIPHLSGTSQLRSQASETVFTSLHFNESALDDAVLNCEGASMDAIDAAQGLLRSRNLNGDS